MGILKKVFTPFILCLLGVIIVLIAVWLWQGGFKSLRLQRNLADIFQVRGEEEKESVTRATPKVLPKEAMFYQQLDGKKVWCQLCFRKCIISNGQHGFCRNRENRDGKLYSLVYAQPCAVHIDPIEKEPQLHMLPGSDILCLATVSCNFRCKQCHNWHISQVGLGEVREYNLSPEEVVKEALRQGVNSISFTYTEPLRKPPKVLDAVKIDLKAFTKEFYREICEAEPESVLKTLKVLKEEGTFFEIVNLLIPTLNDNPEEIKKMCIWIKDNLGEDIPLHFSRFTPAYRLTHLPPTPIKTLEEAIRIAQGVGLKYVYIGNVPGHKYNSTFCPKCDKRLIHRIHFSVLSNNIKDGKCKFCQYEIHGIWR